MHVFLYGHHSTVQCVASGVAERLAIAPVLCLHSAEQNLSCLSFCLCLSAFTVHIYIYIYIYISTVVSTLTYTNIPSTFHELQRNSGLGTPLAVEAMLLWLLANWWRERKILLTKFCMLAAGGCGPGFPLVSRPFATLLRSSLCKSTICCSYE